MKVLGFFVIVMGLIIVYIGITGSQHRIMAIITGLPLAASGKKISPSGAGNEISGTTKKATTGTTTGTMT